MTTERIKEGLQFAMLANTIHETDRAMLKRNENEVVLQYQFSESRLSHNAKSSVRAYHLKFTFTKEYLKAFTTSDTGLANYFIETLQDDICCNTQMILYEIINCKLTGMFRKIFFESKALALLLCFQSNAVKQPTDCSSCKFLTKAIEKDKVIKAKEIILSSLNNPPTIPELALETGINQCYLKKGFKEIFGCTVYDFIQEQRMLKAKHLLTTTDCTVSEVAFEIGFSSQSNFSNAFKKHTGVFPSQLLQNQ